MNPDPNNPTNLNPAGNPVDLNAQDPAAPTAGVEDTIPVAPENPAAEEVQPTSPVVPAAEVGLPPVGPQPQPTVQPGEQGEALSE